MTKLVPDEHERMVDAVDALSVRSREEVEEAGRRLAAHWRARREYERDYQQRLAVARRLVQG